MKEKYMNAYKQHNATQKMTKQISEKQQNQLLSHRVQADDWPY